MSDLDFLDPPVEVLEKPLPPREDPLAFHADRIRSMEDELLEESLEVVEGALMFAHIAPDQKEPPEEWVERWGREKAERMFRLAGYGLMANKDAPVGIKVARDIATGILRNRATEKMGPRELNVAFVQMPMAALPQYPEKEIE